MGKLFCGELILQVGKLFAPLLHSLDVSCLGLLQLFPGRLQFRLASTVPPGSFLTEVLIALLPDGFQACDFRYLGDIVSVQRIDESQ